MSLAICLSVSIDWLLVDIWILEAWKFKLDAAVMVGGGGDDSISAELKKVPKRSVSRIFVPKNVPKFYARNRQNNSLPKFM